MEMVEVIMGCLELLGSIDGYIGLHRRGILTFSSVSGFFLVLS